MTSAESVTYKSTDPPAPAGTSAPLATILPIGELSVDTNGRGCPVGHNVRNPNGDRGTTVTFNE
jgi:hypothetical protein